MTKIQKFAFNKLIRDKLDIVLEKKGLKLNKKTLTNAQLKSAFYQKFQEELREVFETTDETAIQEELADLLEVIHAYAHFQGIPFAKIEEARKEKKNKRGGFDTELFIESVEICSENPACAYYQSRPQQYPEIT